MPLIMDFNVEVSAGRYARLAAAFAVAADGMSEREAAGAAIAYVRGLNDELGIPPLGRLIERRDLDRLAEKAAANTSAPSNPRDAGAREFRAMFAAGLA